jgi:UDP-N-acetylmuramoyl-L-alanyl-D-glutamate--2,6-diaminopimelate ligase
VWTINAYLQEMVSEGLSHCFMEVSSHGIAQMRIKGLTFEGAIFTNLSQDHLDYHKTFANYRDTKKLLFDGLSPTAFALVNSDDKNGLFMLQNTKAKKMSYGLKGVADFKAQILENQFSGQLLKIDQQEVWTTLLGQFNAYNILAIYATATLLGLNTLEVLQHISTLENVAGRFQYFISKNQITAIVDYAHTPDALDNILETIGQIRTKNEKLITVVGCGGDRDQGKRPLMGAIAAEKSDTVILTSDNPRSETPIAIIEQMEAGVSPVDIKKVLVVENRKQAIKTACMMATPKDIILIAGKGHEKYQDIKGVKTPFDDYEIVKNHLDLLDH